MYYIQIIEKNKKDQIVSYYYHHWFDCLRYNYMLI